MIRVDCGQSGQTMANKLGLRLHLKTGRCTCICARATISSSLVGHARLFQTKVVGTLWHDVDASMQLICSS